MRAVESWPSLRVALERWEAQRPSAPFLIAAEDGRSVSYAAFAHGVRALRRSLGPTPRTIALALPGGIEASLVWLAALTGGHCLLPCPPEAPDDERTRCIRAHRPDVLVLAQPEEAAAFGAPRAQVLTLADLTALVLGNVAAETSAGGFPTREGAVRLTTSGTTGDPKGVVLTARQIAWTADAVRTSHTLTPEDRGLCVLPFFHINAPVVSLCATLLAGGTVVIAQRFSLRHFWEWAERERVTWASIVPTIVALLLTTERPAFLPGALRFVRTASAPLPVARHLAFEARFGIPVIETYGLSEAASQVTANPLPPQRRKPGAVGLPVGVELCICEPLDEATGSGLRTVAPGRTGEVCVRGPSVIACYEGSESASNFFDGWFRTGDLGYLDGEGYLFLTGRLREVINRGGEKVAPREIEELLVSHPTIDDAAVVGEPHPLYGQCVVAYVVPTSMWDEQSERRLREYCARHLSAYKVPEAFYRVEVLPRNGNGKLARKLLERTLAGAETSGERRGVLAHG
jgi:acyl-CoA synthetase (AMP-forming)/AMP-acid ligase II